MRRIGGADEEARRGFDRPPRGQDAVVAHPPDQAYDVLGIEVVHRLGVGLIAGGGVVAVQNQNVAHALRGGAQQVADQRDAVAIAAGNLEHGIDAVARQNGGRRETAERRAGAGRVGHVDRIDPAFERRGLGRQGAGVGGQRRRDLGRDRERAGGQAALQVAPWGHGSASLCPFLPSHDSLARPTPHGSRP